MGSFSYWISLIRRRFGKGKNLGGEDKPLETVVIPTASMIASWAKNERDDITQVWIFGSAICHEDWDSFNDDLDILLVVADEKWTYDTAHDLPREIPLSKQYLKIDARVCSESTYHACVCDIKGLPLPEDDEDARSSSIVECAIKTGVCIFNRADMGEKDSVGNGD